MKKKQITAMILLAMTTNMVATPVSAFAAGRGNEVVQAAEEESNNSIIEETEEVESDESDSKDEIDNEESIEGDITVDEEVVEDEPVEDEIVDGEQSNNSNTALEVENESDVTEEVKVEELAQVEVPVEEKVSEEASIEKFKLYGNSMLAEYDEVFKVQRSEISSFTNNGGKYGSSTLDKAFDNKISTHFETGKSNSENFTNEIVVTFDEEKTINRIVYAARQDGAKGKGFAKNVEIYASTSDGEDDFSLVCTGEYRGSTADVVEIKFSPTEFKRLKFVFKEANQGWASASELWFYEEDRVSDIMKELFTDSSKYEINEEYNDLDIINELENEIENHPLKDTYIEDLMIAKQIIEGNTSGEYSESMIRVSSIAKSKDIDKYDEEFKINTSEYKKVTNNGGHYGQSVLTKLYDGDKNTHWETRKANSDTFTNEVEFTFKSIQEIEKIIMTPRKDAGHKGFPLEYEVYGSLNEDSDDYKLITRGTSTSVLSSDFEIVFNAAKFKKLKFRFVNAYQGMAALSEMSFYSKDDVTTEVNKVFTDNLHTTLSENYNSIEEISELEDKVLNHPLKADYMEIINAAKSIINGDKEVVSKTITLSQRGDENAKKSELRQIFAGGNLDVTGYYVMPGETFEVYVDADENGVLPQLAFAQVGEVDGAGNHRFNLAVGKNVVSAPGGEGRTKAFAIYFTNRALPEEQSYAPKVKISGENLKSYPLYVHGETDPQEYIESVKNHTGANMTDVVGERYLLSVQNSEAKIAYVDRGYSPDKTNKDMEEMIAIYDRLAGYDLNDEKSMHRPSMALYHYKATNTSGLYASNEYIHYSASSARNMLSGEVTGWGFVHEFAHQIENADMRLIEVTNNIYSLLVQRNYGDILRDLTGVQKNVDKYFTYNEGTKGFGGFGTTYDFTFGLFERLLVHMQIIDYFGENVYSKANRLMRENPSRYNGKGAYQSIICTLSEASGYDLASHFEYYNYPVTDATKQFTSQFKALDKKIRYISAYDYTKARAEVEVFTEETKAIIEDIKRESDGFTLNLNTTDHNEALTAYEIYRDGEFVGFSRSNTYKDVVDSSKEYTYEVIAYDYRVNESIKSDSVATNVSYRPEIKGYDNVTIQLKEEFNPLDHVSAFAYNGEVIATENIKVVSNNVDNTKSGTYEVEYEVEDRGIKGVKTLKVTVVNKYDYLSDNQWTSVKTAWGTPRRNSEIKGRVNGEIKTFEKGFGIHANGEIVYDLGEHNYENFEALVGVDMTLASQNNSSIKFRITADGETLTETGIIKHADDMIYINVPVKGVRKLKIEVLDAGNGNTLDHSVIANPILTTNNSKPVLEVEGNVAIKLGESLENIVGTFSANDIEDGDITNNVVVSGAENVNINRAGKYEITYSITDSDQNRVEKVRTISVVNMKEFINLTDIEYKSANQGWAKLVIDKAVSGNALRLTDENNKEVIYQKGLGTHSTSTIVYDLTDKDYDYFSSYIGVDRAMYNSIGSVVFQVFLDGTKVYDSGLMKAKDVQKYVEVSLANASELKLVVTDGGNGNGSDHANWAGAKLYSGNSNINLAELEGLLNEVESLNKSSYTDESFENLAKIRDEALSILSSGYTQVEIDSLYERLEEAKNLLVEKITPERAELQELLAYADTIDKSMASTSSHLEVKWYNFNIFRDTVREWLNDKTKTEDEIKSAIITLNYFIGELDIK